MSNESENLSSDLFGDTLTADEQSYFDSGGKHELPQIDQEGGQERQTQEMSPNGAEPEQAAQEPAQDDREDNEIVIDENGRVKDKTTGRFVPHAALHKERTRRQEIEQKYFEAERARATVEGKIEALNAALGYQQGTGQPNATTEPEKPIDPEEDIFGAYKQQQTMLEKLSNQLQEQQKAATQTSEFTRVQNAYVQDAVRFNEQSPDFPDAYKFVKNQMHRELEAQGIADANQREGFIKEQELQLVRGAFQQGRSPAEIIYALAGTRGYTKAQQQQAVDAKQATEKVQTIRAVQQQAASLSGKGQGATDAGLTYEQLAAMSDDEMYEFAQRSPAAFKRMMSGG